jgi:nucleotide-binding universal stress UspA family protein
MSPGRIVVGVSTSLPGLAALRYAVGEARRRGLGAITAVRAWPDPDHGRQSSPLWAGDLARASVHEIDAAIAAAFGLPPADVTITKQCPPGRPGLALADAAGDSDLIVVGSRRHRWFGTGVARLCIRHAPCPVLVIPPPVPVARISGRRMDEELRRMTQPGVRRSSSDS